MKDFLVKYFKGNTAIRKALALILVVAVSIGMSSIDASAAKKVGINRKSASIYAGKTVQLKLTGTSIKSVKTSNKKVAIVSKKGLVKGLSAGRATITLTGKNKKSYKCTVNVVAYINKKAVSLYEGASYQLKLVGTGIKAVSTSRKAVATVTKAGKVTAKGAGKTVITLKGKNNKKYQCTVTVKKVTISATSKALALGKTFTLKLNGTGIKAASSNNTAVATVTKAGVVKGVKVGTAIITLKGNNNKTYTCKVTVTAAITGVEISTTTPVMGQTLVTNLLPAGASNVKSYQWYRTKEADELMIKGENKSTYTVGAGDIGCSLYCVVTDKSGNKFYTKETSKITAVKITELKVTGMSGKKAKTDKTATIPVVDDTLELVTDPDISGDLLDIQWYRGTSKIVGATNKTYTLTGDDIGYAVSVKIEAKDDTIVKINSDATSAEAGEVVDKVSNLTMKLSKTENIEVDDEITVSVKKGDTDLSSKVSFQWYVDSVSTETAITTGATGKTYKVKDVDNGKKLICVVTGVYSQGYYGDFELSTGKAAKKIVAPTVKNDVDGTTFDATLGVGNQLIASFTDKNTTATYQWLRDGSEISGATSAIYTFTSADADETTHKYEVVVKGTGAYIGEEKVAAGKVAQQYKFEVKKTTQLNRFGVFVGNNADPLVDAKEVHIGDVLTAKTVPAAAVGNVVFAWTYNNTEGEQTVYGSSFTVPTDIKVFDETSDDTKKATDITVTAKYTGDTDDNWTVEGTETKDTPYYLSSDGSTVVNSISDMSYDDAVSSKSVLTLNPYRAFTGATLVFDNSAIGNTSATGYKSYNTPEVGTYAHVKVTPAVNGTKYQWFRDYVVGGTNSDNNVGESAVENTNYTITSDDIGHTLTCVATGDDSGSYKKAQAIATSTSAVKVSSRTLAGFKIVKSDEEDDIKTKEAYDSATSVTSMSAGEKYAVVALDSTGVVTKVKTQDDKEVIKGLNITWDASKASDYVSNEATWTATAGKGIVTVTVTPDGKNYTGEAKSYTFKTEIAGASSGSVSAAVGEVTYEMAGATIVPKTKSESGFDEVSTEIALTPNVDGVTAIKKVEWYEASSPSGAGLIVSEALDTDGVSLKAAKIVNGKYYFAVITDLNDKSYTGDRVKAVAPVATKFSIATATTTGELVVDDAFTAVDQFDATYDLQAEPVAVTVIEKTVDDENIGTVTVTGAAGTNENKEKITIAKAGEGNFAAEDTVTFKLGSQKFKATFTGITAFSLAEVTAQ